MPSRCMICGTIEPFCKHTATQPKMVDNLASLELIRTIAAVATLLIATSNFIMMIWYITHM